MYSRLSLSSSSSVCSSIYNVPIIEFIMKLSLKRAKKLVSDDITIAYVGEITYNVFSHRR